MTRIEGNIVDVVNRKIYPGVINVEGGVIQSIEENNKIYDSFISPGFIDAHVHIESSMLLPEEFSKIVIQKGTVSVITDPHEIANVLGRQGIEFMIEHSKNSFLKIFFTIPSCVPSSSFDETGAQITSSDVEGLLKNHSFVGLSEMMNVPGVIFDDPEVIRKIRLTQEYHLPVDGHAPGLRGDHLKKYISAGITTDHECTTIEEAKEKIQRGMKILIREGSAARNYEALKELIDLYPNDVMFCTDDSHPDNLLEFGHIDKIVRRAISDGYDLFDVLKIACLNPIEHYQLKVGSLQVGSAADFVIFRDLKSFEVLSVYVNGKENFNIHSPFPESNTENLICENLNCFHHDMITASQIQKKVNEKELVCMKVLPNELITEKIVFLISSYENFQSDTKKDILKIIYINRYENKQPQIAFIHGMGLKRGAMASSISHDSHNIIAVGTNDSDLLDAINTIILQKGGICIADKGEKEILPLPIGGIMTNKGGIEIAEQWKKIQNRLKQMGCPLESPFMTLSFMALIVIPELKIGERGLFEFSRFNFISE